MSDPAKLDRLSAATFAMTGTVAADPANGLQAVEPTPAATIILFRKSEGTSGDALLMVKRTQTMAFAANALAFPGGKIEADDHALAAMPEHLRGGPRDAVESAHRIGCIRELLEETGIALGTLLAPDAATLLDWRARLKQGEPFSVLLREGPYALDLDAVTPWARWCPGAGHNRRFDTRFYIAAAGPDMVVDVDLDELQSHLWVSAQDAIDGAGAGRHRIIFPTMRNLERVAAHCTFEKAVAHAQSVEVRTISPRVLDLDDGRWVCIPEDCGYPVTRQKVWEVAKP